MSTVDIEDLITRNHLLRSGVDMSFVHANKGSWPCSIVKTSKTTQKSKEIYPTELFNIFIPTRDVTLHEVTGVLGRRDFKYSLGRIGFAPSQETRILEWVGKMEGYTFFFNPAVIAKASKECFDEDFENLKWRNAKGVFAPAIAYLGLDIAHQISTEFPAGQVHVDRQIETFLSMIIRRYSSTFERDTALVGIYSPLILRVTDYVDRNFGRPLTLDLISSECGASKSHLGRLFRDEMGNSIWAYVQQRRLSAAANLLVTSEQRVYRIGQCCGYTDSKNFSRQFKSRYNMSPEKYRHFSR